MNAHTTFRTEEFGPRDPYKHARVAGGMTMIAVTAAQYLQRGDHQRALATLRDGLERYDAFWANHVWPITPPALSDDEMAQLIREDEAADRRSAEWDACKELAARNGGAL